MHKNLTLGLYVAVLVLASCASPTVVPATSAPAATLAPLPTYTPYPTYTPAGAVIATQLVTVAVTQITTQVIAATPLPATQSSTNEASLDDALAAFRAAGLPISDTVILTADTDPNKLLGRPHQYVAKVDWRDSRLDTAGDPGIDTGGTLELFSNSDDLATRKAYVDGLSQSPLFAEYSYGNGNLLLRISGKLTPVQAAEYAAVFAKLP